MLKYIDSRKMGRGRHGWLDSHFHFSFAEYYNPENMRFGVLRVLNDDSVLPGTGFDTHRHKNMEIISYVIDGELTHSDSMNNKRVLKRGEVQYMSAGTGVSHSEHNLGHRPLRFLQIWISPDKDNYAPSYGDRQFPFEARIDKWLPIASGDKASNAPINIHADINAYAIEISDGNTANFSVKPSRQAYLVLIEGEAVIEEIRLSERDALEITEQDITIKAVKKAHILVIEMSGK